jgi:hypothetical protein
VQAFGLRKGQDVDSRCTDLGAITIRPGTPA